MKIKNSMKEIILHFISDTYDQEQQQLSHLNDCKHQASKQKEN